MAVFGVTQEVFEYELNSDPDKGTDNATKFKLKALSVEVIAELKDGNAKMKQQFKKGQDSSLDISSHTGKTAISIVRAGLTGWSNFKDSKGEDIPFETERDKLPGVLGNFDLVTLKTLNKLKYPWIEELAKAIETRNSLSEEDEKN